MTQVSNDKLMEMLLDIKGDVGEIKGQGATFIKQMEVADNRATALEGRVRSVEGKQWWLAGAGSAVGALAGWLGVHLKA